MTEAKSRIALHVKKTRGTNVDPENGPRPRNVAQQFDCWSFGVTRFFKGISCTWVSSCWFVNESCAIERKHTHTTHMKKLKSLLVQLNVMDQHLSRSTSAIMCNYGLQRHARTTFIHLRTTAQQDMITLFWSSPEMENKCYQKLYNDSALFFLFTLMQCHLL